MFVVVGKFAERSRKKNKKRRRRSSVDSTSTPEGKVFVRRSLVGRRRSNEWRRRRRKRSGKDEQRDEVEEEEMASEDTEMVTGPSGEGTSAGASASAGSNRPKRFEIKKWNAVALWAWGMRLLLVPIVLFLGMQSERRNFLVYEKKIDQRERFFFFHRISVNGEEVSEERMYCLSSAGTRIIGC